MKLKRDEVRAAHACASWLIGYPDETLSARLGDIASLASGLDGRLADPLGRCASALAAEDPIRLCEQYVETFDTRRRGCLHLTYYSSGDTRRRGMELIDLTETYRRSGLAVGAQELPDHLSVVLEFSAATSLSVGLGILGRHRPGIELLRRNLTESASPWQGAIDAVCATLPTMSASELEAMFSLAATGPESETVGLDGYGAGAFDQIYPASRPGPTFEATGPMPVAMPTRRSATSEAVRS